MEGKELLKQFKYLPEHQQNKILVDAYKQIAKLHQSVRSYDSFTWRDCSIENDVLMINASIDNYFNEEAFQRNLLDYAKLIYCLTTGNKSAESMSLDAGRKIESAVLREIVLTICGRNDSVNPLIDKLNQPYKDEDTFFEDYSTVDEKEAADAYKKQQEIEQENHKSEQNEKATEFIFKGPVNTSPTKPWYTKWWYFLLLFLIIGGVRACKQSKQIKNQSILYHQQGVHVRNNMNRHQYKNVQIDLQKELKRNAHINYRSTDSNTSD